MSSGSKSFLNDGLKELIGRTIEWATWESLILENGITIDRHRGSRHPDHTSIIYPIDYGYVNGTLATDGHELDVFRGTADTGLIGTIITIDHRKGDTEFKLLYHCRPEEIYLVNGFINFDRTLMEGVLILRWEMEELWRRVGAGT